MSDNVDGGGDLRDSSVVSWRDFLSNTGQSVRIAVSNPAGIGFYGQEESDHSS